MSEIPALKPFSGKVYYTFSVMDNVPLSPNKLCILFFWASPYISGAGGKGTTIILSGCFSRGSPHFLPVSLAQCLLSWATKFCQEESVCPEMCDLSWVLQSSLALRWRIKHILATRVAVMLLFVSTEPESELCVSNKDFGGKCCRKVLGEGIILSQSRAVVSMKWEGHREHQRSSRAWTAEGGLDSLEKRAIM